MASQRRTTFAKNSNFQPFKMSVAFRPGRGAGNDQPSWFFPALIFVFRELSKRRWRCHLVAVASLPITGPASGSFVWPIRHRNRRVICVFRDDAPSAGAPHRHSHHEFDPGSFQSAANRQVVCRRHWKSHLRLTKTVGLQQCDVPAPTSGAPPRESSAQHRTTTAHRLTAENFAAKYGGVAQHAETGVCQTHSLQGPDKVGCCTLRRGVSNRADAELVGSGDTSDRAVHLVASMIIPEQ
jgi:hypothetical protein